MESGLFVGIDHGGSTTTALVFDPDRGKLARESLRMPKHTPRIGWVEHDPENFLATSIGSATAALDAAGRSWRDVAGVGIANQGETSMAWSTRRGTGLGPALSWEDRRTAAMCDELVRDGVDDLIRARTGILLDPYFSASKFRWLLQARDDVSAARKDGSLRLGGTDSFVIDRLTAGAVHATDAATGSRTALLNLYSGHWDPDLLSAFDLDVSLLPKILPTVGDFGAIRHPDVNAAAVPITADAVDAHAALFAQGCRDSSRVKATYGTGAFIEVNTGREPVKPDGKLPVFIAWDLGSGIEYTLEGGVFSVGSAIDWCVGAGLLPSAADSSDMAESVANSGGVVMVPSFAGLSAPYWKSGARAWVSGLGLDTNAAHVARALLDGIAFQCADIVRALDERLGGRRGEIRADGGPSANRYLMQRQADLLATPIRVSTEPDMTALGAALLAGIGAGQLDIADVAGMEIPAVTFEPTIGADEREASWAEWRRSVAMVSGEAGA